MARDLRQQNFPHRQANGIRYPLRCILGGKALFHNLLEFRLINHFPNTCSTNFLLKAFVSSSGSASTHHREESFSCLVGLIQPEGQAPVPRRSFPPFPLTAGSVIKRILRCERKNGKARWRYSNPFCSGNCYRRIGVPGSRRRLVHPYFLSRLPLYRLVSPIRICCPCRFFSTFTPFSLKSFSLQFHSRMRTLASCSMSPDSLSSDTEGSGFALPFGSRLSCQGMGKNC